MNEIAISWTATFRLLPSPVFEYEMYDCNVHLELFDQSTKLNGDLPVIKKYQSQQKIAQKREMKMKLDMGLVLPYLLLVVQARQYKTRPNSQLSSLAAPQWRYKPWVVRNNCSRRTWT